MDQKKASVLKCSGLKMRNKMWDYLKDRKLPEAGKFENYSHTFQCLHVDDMCAREFDIGVIGSTCISRSAKGKSAGWCSEYTLPLPCFLRWWIEYQPAALVHENTPRMKWKGKQTVLKAHYHVESRVLCPSLLRKPLRRRRRFSVMRHHLKVRRIRACNGSSCERVFQD